MSKTTRRKYDLKFKMRVALEVYKGEKALSQVASENGIAHYSLDWLLRVGVPGDGRAIVSPNPMRGRRQMALRPCPSRRPGGVLPLAAARAPKGLMGTCRAPYAPVDGVDGVAPRRVPPGEARVARSRPRGRLGVRPRRAAQARERDARCGAERQGGRPPTVPHASPPPAGPGARPPRDAGPAPCRRRGQGHVPGIRGRRRASPLRGAIATRRTRTAPCSHRGTCRACP